MAIDIHNIESRIDALAKTDREFTTASPVHWWRILSKAGTPKIAIDQDRVAKRGVQYTIRLFNGRESFNVFSLFDCGEELLTAMFERVVAKHENYDQLIDTIANRRQNGGYYLVSDGVTPDDTWVDVSGGKPCSKSEDARVMYGWIERG